MVFGAGSAGPGWGNGKAAAVQYAREGARVVCVDQYRAAAEGTAHIITLEGGAALALKADVTRSDEVGRAVEETVRAFGAIDILHNNVGVADVGELEDITEARWHKVIDANLTGPYLTCRRVIPVMMRAGRGAIINISSVAGTSINQYPYFSYSASKAALNHFTRAIAVRYAAHGIRANVVAPGLIDTPMVERLLAGQHDDLAAMQLTRAALPPMKRQGDAWDVARAAAFLASDDSSYITGICLPVDGGLSCLTG